MQSLLPVGATASPFSLLNQHAKQMSLESLLNDAPQTLTIVFFASTFLPGDIALLKSCQRFVEQNPQSPLVAICGANWESQRELALELELGFPLLFDACCRQAKKFGATWIPKFVNGRAIFQLDRSAHIIYSSKDSLPSA